MHSSIYPSIHQLMGPSIHVSICLPIIVSPSVHSSFFHLSFHIFMYSSVCLTITHLLMHPFIYLSVMVIINICWFLSARYHAKCFKFIVLWQIYEAERCELCFCSCRCFSILLFMVPLGSFSPTSCGLGGSSSHSALIHLPHSLATVIYGRTEYVS